MVDRVEDLLIEPLVTQLLAAVVVENRARGGEGFCYEGMLPGAAVALAECGEGGCGGQLWARIAQGYPSTSFPGPVEAFASVRPPLHAWTVEFGIVRGVAMTRGRVGKQSTMPPTADQWAEASSVQLSDMNTIRTAVCAYLEQEDIMFLPASWDPVGPDGGCLGGQWTFLISQDF